MENVEVIEVRSDSDTEERSDFQTETVTVKSEILENVAESSGSNIASSSSTEDGENVEMDGETLLSILLDKPVEMLLKEKPSGIHTDKVFTLNSKYISIQSMKADDNGAYVYNGKRTITTIPRERLSFINMMTYFIIIINV